MQILWAFTLQVAGGGGGVACSAPSIQMYCAMTYGHCVLCLRHNTCPRPRDKKARLERRGGGGGGGGGAIIRDASPAASLPPRHWYWIQINSKKLRIEALNSSEWKFLSIPFLGTPCRMFMLRKLRSELLSPAKNQLCCDSKAITSLRHISTK